MKNTNTLEVTTAEIGQINPEPQPVKRGRGRPAKNKSEEIDFDPSCINLVRGNELKFNNSILQPLATGKEIDTILSTEGGLMPGTNLVLAGGPGSGKSTITLDILADLTQQGYKCLFISGEMDEKRHFKMCQRMPQFGCVETLFLQGHRTNVKQVLEYVLASGYDVVGVDSIAEVLELYKEIYRCSTKEAESWFLNLQDQHKAGENDGKYYTSFINIQQLTKGGDAAGSKRLQHMTEATAIVEKDKDGVMRSIYFEKNRDCDKDFKMYFSFYNNELNYSYATVDED